METIAVSEGCRILCFMAIHDLGETIHDPCAERIRFRIISESFLRISNAKQMIDCFSKADYSEHAGEVVQGYKAFLHEEVGFEEIGLIDKEVDAVIHILQHQAGIIRKHTVQEVFRIFCFQRAFIQAETRQCESAAAYLQAIVAGGNRIIVAPFLAEHAVIGKGRLCSLHHALDRKLHEFFRSDIRVIFDGEIRNCQLHLLGEFQHDSAGQRVLGAEVCMNEGVVQGAVDVQKEEPQLFLCLFIACRLNKWFQQIVPVAQVYREGGYGRYIVIHDQKRVQCFS